jgi:hypothetical protein
MCQKPGWQPAVRSTPMISKHRFQSLFVLLLLGPQFFASFEALAQVKLPAKSRPKISKDQFTLVIEDKKYSLSFPSPKGTQSVPIPTEWLAPHEELAEEEEQPFSSVLYSKRVTSFPIGNGEIALQFSSFDMMTEGSMMGAGGRDVFLIFNPADSSLRPGLINLGVTKDRARDDGCFHALMTHFLIADANADGNLDIGIVKEEIKCPGEEDWPGGPTYVQHNLHWYLFTPEGWSKEEGSSWTHDYEELPLVDIYLSPVDSVGAFLWGTYDSSKWMSPPTYTPTYRKKLLQEERRKSPKFRRYIPEQLVPKSNQQSQ